MLVAAGLAFFSAVTFAFNNAALRRGVVSGSVAQAMLITVPMGAVFCWLAVLVSGSLPAVAAIAPSGYLLLGGAGVLHFVGGRYCNYRATKAMGTILVGPVQQLGIFITLLLAVLLLGEQVSLLQLVGIGLILAGPLLALDLGRLRENLSRALGRSAPVAAVAQPDADPARPVFRLREGYAFALLSALAFGASPLLISAGISAQSGLAGGLAASAISYSAAAIVVLLVLLPRARVSGVTKIAPDALKWFTLTGLMVTISQICVYMALAIAPVSVVIPIQRTAIVLRVGVARLLNPHLENFDGRVILATICSLAGAVAVAIDPDAIFGLFKP